MSQVQSYIFSSHSHGSAAKLRTIYTPDDMLYLVVCWCKIIYSTNDGQLMKNSILRVIIKIFHG